MLVVSERDCRLVVGAFDKIFSQSPQAAVPRFRHGREVCGWRRTMPLQGQQVVEVYTEARLMGFLSVSFELRRRTYTRTFALHLTKILEPKPLPRPEAGSSEKLASLWRQTDGLGDMWEDAKLGELFKYLLGCRGLRIPRQWEWLIPRHLH